MIVVRDAGSVLVHAHNTGIDHLRRRIMTDGQRVQDLIPDASPPRSAILIAGSRYSGSLRGKLFCEAFGGLIALIRPDWKIGGGFKFKSARFAGPNVADASLAHAC